MSIQNEIERLQFDIADSYSAVYEKSGELPESDERNADNLPSAIRSITSASELNFTGGLEKKGLDVTVVTPVRASLTREEYNALPENERNQGMYVVTSPSSLKTQSISVGNPSSDNILKNPFYGGNKYVVSLSASRNIATSEDGITWSLADSGVYNLDGVGMYGAGKYVIVRNDNIYISDDAITWTLSFRMPGNFDVDSFGLYDGSKFIAYAKNVHMATSVDGITWNAMTHSIGVGFDAVAYNDEIYVGVSSNRRDSYISADGLNWTTGSYIGSGGSNYDIACGNGIFAVLHSNNSIYRSANGSDWAEVLNVASVGISLQKISYGDGVFIAAGYDGVNYKFFIFYSVDAVHWYKHQVIPTPVLGTMCSCYGNGKFLITYNNYSRNALLVEYIPPSVESIIIDGNETKIPSDIHIFSDGLTDTEGDISVTTPVRGVFTQEAFDALPEEEQNKGFYIINDEEAAE